MKNKILDPHISFIPKVIPLKLSLDMVQSSSADVTRAVYLFYFKCKLGFLPVNEIEKI